MFAKIIAGAAALAYPIYLLCSKNNATERPPATTSNVDLEHIEREYFALLRLSLKENYNQEPMENVVVSYKGSLVLNLSVFDCLNMSNVNLKRNIICNHRFYDFQHVPSFLTNDILAFKSRNFFSLINCCDDKILLRILIFNHHSVELLCVHEDLLPTNLNDGDTFFGQISNTNMSPNQPYNILFIFSNGNRIFADHYTFTLSTIKPPSLLTLNVKPPVVSRKLTTPCDELLEFFDINEYQPSPEIQILTKNKYISSNDMTVAAMRLLKIIMGYTEFEGNLLNVLNYTKMLTLFIEMEYAAAELEMYDFDQFDKTVTSIPKQSTKYILNLPELLHDRNVSIIGKNDQLWLVPMKVYNTKSSEIIERHRIMATVECITGTKVCISTNKSYGHKLPNNNIKTDETYYIHFKSNGAVYKFERNAVNIIDKYNLSTYFFPKIPKMIPTKLYYTFNWFNKNIIDNPMQQQAIINIVNGTSFPAPYLLFGPPGTGKTSTLIETICQLYVLQPSSKLLICATSNAACNEIGYRLLKFIPKNVLFRIFSASYDIENVTDKLLLKSSNYYSGSYQDPSLSFIYEHAIILCTLALAGKLVLKNKRLTKFTHVFIDECGSSTESQSLLPIAGICNDGNEMKRNIILIGDPKQLGPVLTSKMTNKLGYNYSMMERLMDRALYQRDPITKKYNGNVLTKLLYNFRSHSAMLKLSNELFYDNELIVKGNADITNWCLGWVNLPSKKFPIIFEFTNGVMSKDDKSTSSYNSFEIERVMFYLKRILTYGINDRKVTESDIGIISPYNSQCKKIKTHCKKYNWNNITVGSVEVLQGQEKPIIILSTVRSRTSTIGFLDDPRRLNVAITRAQALMIIIGNPKTLQNDKNWHKLIKYCIDNKAVCGFSFRLKKFTADETTTTTPSISSSSSSTNLAIDNLIPRLAAI